jgi:ribosomal protein S12 methylthiotransferase accessory factor YcaO
MANYEYRKKPVVIQAVKWEPSASPTTLPEWLLDEIGIRPDLFDETTGVLLIHTLEGVMRASPGDWIVRGIKGEIYPVKPDIFQATYEPVP